MTEFVPLLSDDLYDPDLGLRGERLVGCDGQGQVEERPRVDERTEGQSPVLGVDGVAADNVPARTSVLSKASRCL